MKNSRPLNVMCRKAVYPLFKEKAPLFTKTTFLHYRKSNRWQAKKIRGRGWSVCDGDG